LCLLSLWLCVKIPLESFEYLTRIHYRAANLPHDGVFGEHEIDYILFIRRDVTLHPNSNEVRDYRYVTQEELKDMIGNELIWLILLSALSHFSFFQF